MTTTRLLILVLVVIILLTFASVAGAAAASTNASTNAAASAAAEVERRAAAAQGVVILFSRSIDGTACGNGFAVGDGSLIVTARNVVFPRRSAGLHEGDAFVTVLSPHLGQAVEAAVLAEDRALDLVLLRAPWKGHPALQIAEEADLVAAAKLQVLAFASEQAAVVAGRPADLAPLQPHAQAVTLEINAVTVRQGATRAIVTMTAPPPGAGWAGAPMILANTISVGGCYVRTQADGSAGAGVACGAIRRLIDAAGASDALRRDGKPLAKSTRADEATLAYLAGVSASAAGDAAAALGGFRDYLRLRPSSAIGYRDAAGQFRAMNRVQDAQAHYEKALQLDPSLPSARVLYGQLLHERVLSQAAEEHLSYAWTHGGATTTIAALPLCNLLRAQGRDRDCLPVLDDALRRRPRDAHLWSYLGQTKRALADHAGAAAALARAADLMGDDATLRLQAAEQFETAGERARAEFQYQTLIAEHPDAATAHFHFARFLARDSNRSAEAITRAEQALTLADTPGAPPRAVIESLLSAIRAGRTSAGSALRL
jgi:tetratricopeptide (TPR) repeat protein